MSLRTYDVVTLADLGTGFTTFPWDDHAGVGYWRCVDRISRVGQPTGLLFGSKYLHDNFPSQWSIPGVEPYAGIASVDLGPGLPAMQPTPDLTTPSSFYTGQTWGDVYESFSSVGTLASVGLDMGAFLEENAKAVAILSTTAEITQDRASEPRAIAVTITDVYRANNRFGTPYPTQDYTNIYQLVFFRSGDFELNVAQVELDGSSYVVPGVNPAVVGGAMALLTSPSFFLSMVFPPILRGDGPGQMFEALTTYPTVADDTGWHGYLPNQWGVSGAFSTGLDPGAAAPPTDVALSAAAGPVHAGLLGLAPTPREVVVPASRVSLVDYWDERDLVDLGIYTDGGSQPAAASSFNSAVPGRYFFRGWALLWPPTPPTPGTVEPHLRMTQRNDGLGVAKHPRLRASVNGPTSHQRSSSPRLGRNNRYR